MDLHPLYLGVEKDRGNRAMTIEPRPFIRESADATGLAHADEWGLRIAS